MSLLQDVTYSARAMRRSPGVTAIAVLALALGLGANTAIFSVVNAVLLNSAALRSLRDPARLVMVWEKNPAFMAFIAQRMPVMLANFREWKKQSRSFEDMTAFSKLDVNVGGGSTSNRPQRVSAIQVPPNFFSLVGIKPALGRAFLDDDARNSAGRAVIVSDGIYRSRFGTDLHLAGKTVRVDGIERTIVGVMPEKFQLPALSEGTDRNDPELWLPADLDNAKKEADLWGRNYYVYARLRNGVTLEQARSEMDVIGRRLLAAFPEQNKGFGVNVFLVATEDAGPDLRRSLFVLQAAVGFVLLIACANVANLLLARAVSREREIAIRLALGASRGRIIRLMLTESMMLSGMGGALGLLLGGWSLSVISALAPKDTHGFHEMHLDPAVLGVSFLVTLATGFVFGVAPAFHAARQNLTPSIGQGGRTVVSGPRWVRNGMVMAEMALALMLLVGAGLMIRSLAVLTKVDIGFRADHLLTVQVTLEDGADARTFCNRLMEGVSRIPGVVSASISSGLPMERVAQANYNIEGGTPAAGGNFRIAGLTSVTETYFRTMGIPIRRGRDFTRTEAEAADPEAVIVSEAFAQENWPGQDPLGKVVVLKKRAPVVGVVGGIHQMGPDAAPLAEMYLPSRTFWGINLAARTVGDPLKLAPAVEKAVWAIDPNLPVEDMRDMARVLHDWPADRRFLMSILGVFAGLALLLASLGLYGVLAYVVSMRTRELGIRMALGADTWQVSGMVLRQGLALALAGVGLGVAGALVLTRLMKNQVFGVGTNDPVTFTVVAAVLVFVAVAATWLPARRAARVDPAQALRAE